MFFRIECDLFFLFFLDTAMVNYIDGKIAEVVALLQKKGMWNNTLLVMHSE